MAPGCVMAFLLGFLGAGSNATATPAGVQQQKPAAVQRGGTTTPPTVPTAETLPLRV